MNAFIRTYVVPAAVFQSVIIGGGYGTGREVVEFITVHGPVGGLWACFATTLVFAAVLSTSFAYARRFAVYDYRHFVKSLLGRFWPLYELLFVILLVIVIAVVASAAGATAAAGFGVPESLTVSVVLMVVVILNYFGRNVVANAMTLWTVLLMLALVAFVLGAQGGEALQSTVATAGRIDTPAHAAMLSGARFAIYNSALVPVLVYCVAGIGTTRQAWRAGAVAGLSGAFPALLLHRVLSASPTDLTQESLPTLLVLGERGLLEFAPVYYVILMGTVILTAVGVLHGVNERIDGWREDMGRTPWPRAAHAALAGAIVLASLVLANFGIVALVARGYGALSWAFVVVFTVPLLIVGNRRLLA